MLRYAMQLRRAPPHLRISLPWRDHAFRPAAEARQPIPRSHSGLRHIAQGADAARGERDQEDRQGWHEAVEGWATSQSRARSDWPRALCKKRRPALLGQYVGAGIGNNADRDDQWR